MLLWDQTVMGFSRHERGRYLLEILVEGLIVQKHPVVVVVPVESIFHLTNRSGDFPKICISCQGDKGGIHSFTGCRRR